jgi:hypothetical protein
MGTHQHGGPTPAGVRVRIVQRVLALVAAIWHNNRPPYRPDDQLPAARDDLAPGLTDRHGVGPVTAAQVVVTFSHPGRVRSDAAFAALAGSSRLPASSPDPPYPSGGSARPPVP